jgi:hypothetical protein
MKVRKKALLVDAVQLIESTVTEMEQFTLGDHCEHCFVDDEGNVAVTGRLGLQIPTEDPDVVSLVVEGDWVVRDADGKLAGYSQEDFDQAFEPAEDPNRRESVEFKPDWAKFPRLAEVLDVGLGRELAETTVKVLTGELRALLVDARADAAQYVRDVRADELAKARADERARLVDRERLLGEALRQVLVKAKVLSAKATATGPELLGVAEAYCQGLL